MEKEKNLENARKDAFRLLKSRARSEFEISNRLKEKGYDQNIVNDLVSELKRKGFLDDLKFAKLYASDQIEIRFKGPKYVEYELKAFGIEKEIIAEVIDEVLNDIDLKEIFKRFKKAHQRDPEDKLFQKLVNRGFDPYIVKRLLREISKEMEA
jgi:regulatory protein